MKKRIRVKSFLLFAILGVVLGCGIGYFSKDDGNPSDVALQNRAGFEVAFPIALGEKTLNLRLALTDLERQQGLSGCTGLECDNGMIFVYPKEDVRSFWMRGVPIGLSIGFLDSAGTLLEIHEMRAHDLNLTTSRSDRAKYALEMSSGWFEKNGISVGAKLDLRALSSAVEQRGF